MNDQDGDSLWIFTEHNLIKCINFNACTDPKKCKFKIYALGATLYSQITSIDYNAAMIDIQLPNNEIGKFQAINGNLSYLIKIYQDLFFKDASL